MSFFNDDASLNNLIGSGSLITGDLEINGFIRIDGDLIGNLKTNGTVVIGENARILGNIDARSVINIGGIVKGDIIAPESVKLTSTSVVLGDIQTHKLQSDDKSILQGHYISIQDDSDYEEAVSKWINTKAILEKTIKVTNGN